MRLFTFTLFESIIFFSDDLFYLIYVKNDKKNDSCEFLEPVIYFLFVFFCDFPPLFFRLTDPGSPGFLGVPPHIEGTRSVYGTFFLTRE